MNRTEIKDRVFSIIGEHVRRNTVITEDSLIINLDFDRLDLLGILMEFEYEFAINIPDDEWEKVITVSDIIKIIHKIKIP